MNRDGRDALLCNAIELSDAEHYGEVLTHPGGHYEYWEAMKQRGPAWLRARNLSAELLRTEYEDWPRGRVVYHVKKAKFITYADPRVRTGARIALVRTAFRMADIKLVVREDSHYRLPPPSLIPDAEY